MQKIRLTESDLHKIIKESVKQVISELDWETYTNASEKAWRRNEPKRADRFNNAAVDAFNRDHSERADQIKFGDTNSDYSVNMVASKGKDGKPLRDLDIQIDDDRYDLSNIDKIQTPNKAAAKSIARVTNKIGARDLGNTKYNKNTMLNRLRNRVGWQKPDASDDSGWRMYHKYE